MPYLNFSIVNYVIVKKNDEKDKKSFQMKKKDNNWNQYGGQLNAEFENKNKFKNGLGEKKKLISELQSVIEIPIRSKNFYASNIYWGRERVKEIWRKNKIKYNSSHCIVQSSFCHETPY